MAVAKSRAAKPAKARKTTTPKKTAAPPRTAAPAKKTAAQRRAPKAPSGADELAALRERLSREQRESRALREIGLAMGLVVDHDRIPAIIIEKTAEALDAEKATIFLVEGGSRDLVSFAMSANDVESIRVPFGLGIVGHVAEHGKVVRVRDAYRDPRFLDRFDRLTGYRTRSVIAAPMRNSKGAIIGVVQALNKRTGEFTADDEALFAAIAGQAAVCLDYTHLYVAAVQHNERLFDAQRQLSRKVHELDLLFKLESAMGRATTLDELVRAALTEAIGAAAARGGAVLLADESLGQAAVRLLVRGEKRVRRQVVNPNDGFIGRVRREGKALVQMGPEDDGSARKLDEQFHFQTHSAMGAPLDGQGGTPIGAIAIYNKDGGRPFSPDDQTLLRLIGANLSTAVQLFMSRRKQEREERLSTIGRLLSSVIHDLKTPITVVSGYVQLMVGADDPKQRLEYAELVRRQFDLVTAMQREILEFARGDKKLLVRRVYLAAFVQGIVDSMQREAAVHGIELRADVRDRGIARFDEFKITRALHSLMRNSIEALGDKGGHVTVRVERQGKTIVFSVVDDGPGIPVDVKARLFESFATSGKKGGTGLGLATVRKIAEEHGGDVWDASNGPGTVMSIRLPQAD